MNFKINNTCVSCNAKWEWIAIDKTVTRMDEFNDYVVGFYFECTCGGELFVKLDQAELVYCSKKTA